jgi:hypothetical protein
MQMGMMVQLLAPGVQPGEAADVRTEVFGGRRDVLEGLRHGVKEQAIEWAGVLQRQGPQGVRQGKDDMAVWGIEDFLLPRGKPSGLGGAMAFGAAPVAARVVRLDRVPTVVTWRDVSPEGGRPAAGDGAQRAVLCT